MAIAWTEQHKGFYDSQSNWEGVTLKVVHDRNYRIMSDVWGSADWATVWDEATASPKTILVNVYDMNGPDWKPVQITVDATDEIREKYKQWKINLEFKDLLEKAEDAAMRIEKNCIAKVVKGKSGKGTVGKVVVVMEGSYRFGWRANTELKVAIATSDVKVKKALRSGKVAEVYQDVVWVWARNCQRVDVVQIDKEALLQQAQERVVRTLAA